MTSPLCLPLVPLGLQSLPLSTPPGAAAGAARSRFCGRSGRTMGAGERPLPGWGAWTRPWPSSRAAVRKALPQMLQWWCLRFAWILLWFLKDSRLGAEGAGVQPCGVDLLVCQQAAGLAVEGPALGAAEGLLLVLSYCGRHPLSSSSSLRTLSWASWCF